MTNQQVLDLIATYPTDGTHKYYWVNGFDGVTHDLVWNGTVIAKSEPERRTFCCGLTLEIWFSLFDHKLSLSAQDIRKIKADWFVATGKRKGCVDGLVPRGLGTEVLLKDAQPGNFCQLWRKSGSGHSVVYLGHTAETISYWSTQPSTNGIGKRTEKFGKDFVNEVYLVQAK